ncbi:MAG: hypothetical protein K0U37_04615 [Gammaproteobacteria bacterium]|nr:hypothetical protein [Gammaproteobacteria bacterium]
MSERTQRTSAFTREHMAHRYGDDFHHKHDKRHLVYRLHWRSHPNKITPNQEQLEAIKNPTDSFRTPVKEKMWKRLAKTPFH